MNHKIAYSCPAPKSAFEPVELQSNHDLKTDEIEIAVESCGICHSDLSMRDNEWHITAYPFVGGHEIVGTISETGSHVTHLHKGQRVGLGWFSASCGHCPECNSGDHNLCATVQGVIVGRQGGFSTHVRCQARWAIPLPAGLDPSKAGPLFCGGITVFNPIIQCNVKPTHSVGVVGIGGLGHMAIQFLKAWGCEVTAFSTSPSKEDEARKMGAHRFTSTHNSDDLKKLVGSLDFILDTVNAELDWNLYLSLLKPKGKLHIVGAAPAFSAAVFPMLVGQKSVGGSPLGSPQTTATMLDFAARHNINPICEMFPMSNINEAFDHLEAGKARYRIVLTQDAA